jgi:hypothetical protein
MSKQTQKQTMRFSHSFMRVMNQMHNKIADFIINCNYYSAQNFQLIDNYVYDTSSVNYLTFRNDGTISFLPAGKELKYNDLGEWSRDGRQSGRPAKVIRKIFTKRALSLFTDKDFEQFALQYQAKGAAKDFTFSILDNSHIKETYDAERSVDCGASLNGSCMNGDGKYLDLYENCPHLRIITLRDSDNLLAGRALLWTLPNGKQLMDRVYVSEERLYDLFLDFADQNKFTRKVSYKSYSDKTSFTDDNGETTYKATFKIKTDTEFDYYPYIDTFTYGGYGYITNDADNGCEFEYSNTDGTRYGDNCETCAVSGDRISSDDARYIDRGEYADQIIHYDRSVCDVDGNWWYEDDSDIVEVNGKHYPKGHNDIVFIEYDEEYHHIDDCVEDYDGCWILLNDAYKVNGEYYHEDLVEKC